MKYTISQIVDMVMPRGVACHDEDAQVSVLLTDSRSLVNPAGEVLFFALVGEGGDGHRYVASLYESGVRCFVVQHFDASWSDYLWKATFLIVDDTLAALQRLAAAHRRRFHIPVIAITGSRGKTVVKEWLYSALKDDYRIVRSPRSYNSQIGVALSLWEIDGTTTLAIIEAGISRKGEMERLREMINPTLGVLTNVLDDHDEGFASREEKEREKRLLFATCDHVVEPDEADGPSSLDPEEMTRRNRRTCARVLRLLGMDRAEAERRLAALAPVDTRLNVIEGVNDTTLIVDGYTADYSSLPQAVDFMRRRSRGQATTVVLSDLVEDSVVTAPDNCRAVAALMRSRGITRFIGVGEKMCLHRDCFEDMNAMFFSSAAQLTASLTRGDFVNETILLKGRPEFRFDLIVDMLEARGHQTVEEIDLNALAANFKFFKSRLRPTTLTVAMVKASGYGTGSYEIAKTLQDRGADYLAVAVQDEGVQLREAGITMPVIVLNPSVVNYKAMFSHHLEPEVYSVEECRQLIAEGEKMGVVDFPVHVKIDTGMHRLGFTLEQLPALIALLKEQRVLKVASVFSHLCVADEPAQDDYTRAQFEYFDRCVEVLQGACEHHILRHILNTSGIVRFPERQMDMVRIGIGLYGIKTLFDGSEDALIPVASLHSVIISLKEWPAGTTVGYGRHGLLKRDSRIATVTMGYADGLDRHFGNGRISVWVDGVLCPTVGNVCMDAVMIDVTDVKDCRVGDRVEIFGLHVPIESLSEARGTIPYEILTSISPRVKRVYFRE